LVTFINRNLEPYRGYHSFMRALPQMLAGDPQLHVAMVGGEDKGYGAAAPQGKTWRQVYEAEVFGKLTSQQEARVHYLGKLPHDQLVRLYQTSTVHVYLTYPFVLSWSVLEAMSAGCAVVASRTGPVEEVIQDGDNGVLVDFFNPSALVGVDFGVRPATAKNAWPECPPDHC
jgi:glycosyltransferase involved in cell wall biosynthesis